MLKSRFLLLTLAMLVLAAGGIVYGQLSSDNPNRVVLRHQLLPLTQATEGQLQVVDKTGKQLGQCPLEHTSVKAQIAGFVARVEVTQEFTNPLDTPIEAVYIFPLPSDCAVDHMEMTVGDRVIRGDIKRREEARQIYDTARANGQVASLLDQERPNIFTQSVANIMPGAKVKITISFDDVLKYEAGQYEFVFPMVVGPRYIPGAQTGRIGTGREADTNRVPDASKITPPITPEGTRAGHDISVEVDLNAGVKLGDIKSVLHEVNIERPSDTEAKVTLKDLSTIPNKDFILRYRVAGDEVRTGLLPNTRGAGDGYCSFVIVPPKTPTAAQITPKEMIFVIDTSGSQQGWPIEKAKETMKLCIEKMNPGDTFNMLAFSNEVTPLFDKPQQNTPENRAFAQEFLTTRLGSGGTEMMKAIDAALTPPADPKRLRIVCFMTDGYVGNDMEILDQIKKKLGNTRLFPFGIGNSVNRFLLDGMAKMGRGAVEYVTLQEEGKDSSERFYDRISKPVLTDIQIDWGGLPVYDTYPQQIPDLFASKPVVIQARYDKPMTGTILIRGNLGGRPWEERLQVTLPGQADENSALPSLWARAKIADLMERDYQGVQNQNMDPQVKEDIIKVALDYQLMSQFTSFVAVENKIVNQNGKPTTIAVPTDMPDGVSYQGIFGDKLEQKAKSIGAGYAGPQGPAGSSGYISANLAPASPSQAWSYGSSAPVVNTQSNATVTGSLKVMDSSAAGLRSSSATARQTATPRKEAKRDGAKPKYQAYGAHTSGITATDRLDAAKDSDLGVTQNMKPTERRIYQMNAKLDPSLIALVTKSRTDSTNPPNQGKLQIVGRSVRVSILLTALSDANLAKLRALGFKTTASNKMLGMVVGMVPIDKLANLAELEFVTKVSPVTK